MISEQKRAQLQSLVDHGYSFPFSDYISQAFDIFQRKMGLFIGFILMYLVTTAVIGSIPLFGDIAVQVLIDPIFTIGMFIVSHKIARNEVSGFEDFFKGTDRLGDLILTAVISNAITVAAALPFIFFVWQYGILDWFWALEADSEAIFNIPEFPSWTTIFLIPVIYISVAYSWGYQFVYFYGMQAWEGQKMVYFLWVFILIRIDSDIRGVVTGSRLAAYASSCDYCPVCRFCGYQQVR